jgi:hypothetical protein
MVEEDTVDKSVAEVGVLGCDIELESVTAKVELVFVVDVVRAGVGLGSSTWTVAVWPHAIYS